MSAGGVVPVTAGVDPRPQDWWTMVARGLAYATGVCCLGLLWSVAAREDLAVPLMLLFALAVTGLLWVAWSIIGLLEYRAGWISVVAPGLVLVSGALLFSGVPLQLGWWVSESAMERAAIACDSASADRRIGIYAVKYISKQDNGCLLSVPGMGLVGPGGYAYMPYGEPPAADGGYDEEYVHVNGPWYTYTLAS
ncbi:hypothetical protein [Nocardia sp. NPDC058497]|uniref:hypothetical protein n=1 Tax=Nocardia sp. NPDC058497 TaxID=3346529 RepID=UPI00365D13F4